MRVGNAWRSASDLDAGRKEIRMTVKLESLAALGHAHVGFCEQLAWFALESFERAHRLNMDAFESFWARRIAETKVAAGIGAPSFPRDVTAAALLEHWTRTNETAVYLCQEFGRLAGEYADGLKSAASATADAAAPDAPVRSGRARAPRAAEAALANAA
jgi:hypothetical protein